MDHAAGRDGAKLRRQRNLSLTIGLPLLVGGFVTALVGVAVRGEATQWYNVPFVWMFILWFPGLYFVGDAADLHGKMLARLKLDGDKLRRQRNRVTFIGIDILCMWGIYAAMSGVSGLSSMEFTVGMIAFFVAGPLLYLGRTIDARLLERIREEGAVQPVQ